MLYLLPTLTFGMEASLAQKDILTIISSYDRQCRIPPQADCSNGPKRLCCDCEYGQLVCY